MLIGSLADLFICECSDKFVLLEARLLPSYLADVQKAVKIKILRFFYNSHVEAPNFLTTEFYKGITGK